MSVYKFASQFTYLDLNTIMQLQNTKYHMLEKEYKRCTPVITVMWHMGIFWPVSIYYHGNCFPNERA